ncbi:MAG: outer membrane protein assembly factor BamA [Desulfobacteraceae bacterium]|jgi:outer membrane protein insertion porin family
MRLNRGDKELVFLHVRISRIAALMVFCLLVPMLVYAEEKGKVAVLPFRIYAPKPLDHLRKGLQEMLTARLAKKGLNMVSPDVINRHPSAYLPVMEEKDILAIGKDMGADWVIAGSLTQIGTKISMDLKVFDITGKKPPFSLFMVEDDLDKLSDATQRASASIYNQVIGILQIDSIQVKGNKRIESAAILAMVQSKRGDGLDPDQLNKDLRAIYKLGFFTDVSIDIEDGAKGKVVTFSVHEKPSIAQIVFEGNEEEKEKKLKEEVGIKEYSILNRGEIKQSINRLKEYYHQKGYYNVEIKERIEELPQNEVSLIYEIKEGGKIYIRRIEFVGNTKFDDDDLKDIMENSEKGFLSWVTKSGLLDQKKLEFDVQKITSFYHNQGYMKAKVGEPKISYEKDVGLIITMEIVEGPQYRVNEVKIEGDLIRPTDELLERVNIKEEEFFNREVVRKDTMALSTAYADDGYAYAAISPLVNTNDEDHVVDITYRISKGKRVRFERINITGNTITRDKVIRRELRVIEGEYFSGSALGKSQQNLYRLGYFEDVEVQTKKGSQDDLMVLDINVKEQPTGSFSFGAGYSGFENLIGNFSVSQNNLFGRGQRLSGSATIGSRTQNIDVNFTEPWLFDSPISGGITFYTWERKYDEYTRDSFGGGLRVGFPLTYLRLDEFTRGWVRYAYDDAKILDVAEDAAQSIKDMVGKNVTSSFSVGIIRDSKDRPFVTTKGSVNSLSFETAGGFLGGTIDFNKYLATSLWYFPLFWDTVFVAQGRAGYIQETGEPVPVYQKFRIGGINTVRGFEAFSISPRDPDTLEPIGGEQMLIFNLEYRFPFLVEQGIVGLVFFDAGNVFTDDPTALTVSGLRLGAGGGIRWFSPVGPLRVEYGFNLDPDPSLDEKSGEYYFTVGGQF